MLQRVVVMFMLSAAAGYLGATANRSFIVHAQGEVPRSQSARPIPPVPNPPLYPDPPNKFRHWSIDEMHKNFQTRLEYARAHADDTPETIKDVRIPNGTWSGESLRSHSIAGMLFRWQYPHPQQTRFSHMKSIWDDADQHQATSDFEVFVGGKGQLVVDGELENRVYGYKTGPGGKTIVMPGEFEGQPVRNGHTFDINAGDWVSIPPDTPHWYKPAPNEGLGYTHLKILLGWIHPAIIY